MNAVKRFASSLSAESLRRIAAQEVSRFAPGRPIARRTGPLDLSESYERVIARWSGDLCGLLNALVRGELAQLARAHGLDTDHRSPELRAALWEWGAKFERGTADVPPALQPRPVMLGGHLCIQAPPRGLYPACATWPRPLPEPRECDPPGDEPDTLDDLLAAADRTIGVRLGRRGSDKGAWGLRAAALVGVVERGDDEPDWRGDVEIKTVPVAADRRTGLWRVVEDPAIAMMDRERGANRTAIAKLQRTLWLARADCDIGDATIVSWYLLEWDAQLSALVRRYLHDRPKGPARTENRGVYLHKRFFADSGLLATLNGPA